MPPPASRYRSRGDARRTAAGTLLPAGSAARTANTSSGMPPETFCASRRWRRYWTARPFRHTLIAVGKPFAPVEIERGQKRRLLCRNRRVVIVDPTARGRPASSKGESAHVDVDPATDGNLPREHPQPASLGPPRSFRRKQDFSQRPPVAEGRTVRRQPLSYAQDTCSVLTLAARQYRQN